MSGTLAGLSFYALGGRCVCVCVCVWLYGDVSIYLFNYNIICFIMWEEIKYVCLVKLDVGRTLNASGVTFAGSSSASAWLALPSPPPRRPLWPREHVCSAHSPPSAGVFSPFTRKGACGWERHLFFPPSAPRSVLKRRAH